MKALFIQLNPDGNEELFIDGKNMRADGDDFPDLGNLIHFLYEKNQKIDELVVRSFEDENPEERFIWGYFHPWLFDVLNEVFGPEAAAVFSKEYIDDDGEKISIGVDTSAPA